jgi:hypothetical protein
MRHLQRHTGSIAAILHPSFGFVLDFSAAMVVKNVVTRWGKQLVWGLCLAVGCSLAGCHTSRVEDSPTGNTAPPQLEGEWLLLDIQPMPEFRLDPAIAINQRLAWMSSVRKLWRGTVQRPRWVFQKDHSIIVRWTPAGNLRGRRHTGGTWRRNWRTRAITVRSRGGNGDQQVSFSGDTLFLQDPATHLVTRFLPIY